MTALLIVGLLGGVGLLVQELRVRKATRRAEVAEGLARDLVLELELETDQRIEDNARLEAVIAAKKLAVARLMEDLRACSDPAAAVVLAQRLLLDPWDGDHPEAPAPVREAAAPAAVAAGRK